MQSSYSRFDQGLGVVVLIAFIIFVYFVHNHSDEQVIYRQLTAEFSTVDGLAVASPVLLNGITVGYVDEILLLPDSLSPSVTIMVDKAVQVPSDSIVSLRSDTLLGAKHAIIIPGAFDDNMFDGDVFYLTDSGVNVENIIDQLLEIAEANLAN